MKVPHNQRSILSFFGPSNKAKESNVSTLSSKQATTGKDSEKSAKEEGIEDSPIKKVTRSQSRRIESDSEEECSSSSQNKENDIQVLSPVKKDVAISSPAKKRCRITSPPKSDVTEGKQDTEEHVEPKASTSTSSNVGSVGFSKETVPPLRKTARKVMHRKPGSAEELQMERVKTIKLSPQKKDSEMGVDESKDKSTPTIPTKGKRTNCLDQFLFVKVDRKNKDEATKETHDQLSDNISKSCQSPKRSSEDKEEKITENGEEEAKVNDEEKKCLKTSDDLPNSPLRRHSKSSESPKTTEEQNKSPKTNDEAHKTPKRKDENVLTETDKIHKSPKIEEEEDLKPPKSKDKKERKSPKTKGKRNKSPKTKGEESKSPKAKGKRSKSPKTKGEESKSPKAKGKRSKSPKTKGEESKSSETKDKQSKSPKAKGKQSKTPETKGRQSKSPKTEGEERKSPKTNKPKGRKSTETNEEHRTSPKSSHKRITVEEGKNTSQRNSTGKTSPKSTEKSKGTNNIQTSPTTCDASTEEANSSKMSSNLASDASSPSSSKAVKASAFLHCKQNDEKNDFNPSRRGYSPIEDPYWKRGDDVPFSALAKTFKIIEETSGRLKIIEILSNFLRSVIVLSPQDFMFCIYLCLNKVAPSFEGVELGVGEIYVCRAIAQATGRSVNMIKNDITEKGDLGIVAEESKSNQRTMFQPARLTVKKVFKNVKEIALMSGQASQAKKIDKIKSMLVACKGPECRYLIRFFGGKLRIGLAEQSVLQAIAQACFLTPPNQEYPPEVLNAGKGLSADNLKAKIEEHASILKTTYCECPSFDSIIPVLLEKGMKELPNYCKLEPGVPLKPMLAHPTKGVAEVLKRFEKYKFTCEFKYDGERAQIHLLEDGSVKVFSRNQENNTSKYPDIIARLKDSLGADVQSCILDSEAVAYDVKEQKILPFQILSTRKRKDANESEIKVQVCVFPFDLLYLNGRNLVTEPFEVRRELLRQNFVEKEGQFTFAKSIDSTNTEDIEEFLEESIKGNCEGLMVKTLDVEATYEIAKRSRNWLKLKKDYLDGVGDTIDVIVIGGFFGKGKRTGTYGGFLLACYDTENEEFQSLCKIGTGFTEEDLQRHSTFFKEHVIEAPKSYYRVDSTVSPDHWFDAVQVWEIKCADLSISPVHKAGVGIVDPEKGISLRFPRFLRIREDKTPEEATNSSQIADLYRSQEQIKNQAEGNNFVDEDFY